MKQPLCALSVDLDEIDCYRQIHGLPSRGPGATAVYDVALGRIAAFAAEHQVPLTLFAVGRDLERTDSAARLAEVAGGGHQVENHSHGHHYDLSRYGRPAICEQIERAHDRIAEVTGRAPVGFRAPGYTISDPLLDALEQLAYRFDSSVFPCPSYYSAKALALAGLWLRRRQTAAVLDTPRVLLAPTVPYRPSRPWHRRGGRGLVELPIQVTPRLRLPVIGTSLVLAGRRLARRLVKSCIIRGWINIELHGLDFLSGDDGLSDLVAVQPDLRVPLEHKLAVLAGVVAELKTAGARFVMLAEAAAKLPTAP